MGKKEAQGEIADEMGDSSLEEKDWFNIKGWEKGEDVDARQEEACNKKGILSKSSTELECLKGEGDGLEGTTEGDDSPRDVRGHCLLSKGEQKVNKEWEMMAEDKLCGGKERRANHVLHTVRAMAIDRMGSLARHSSNPSVGILS